MGELKESYDKYMQEQELSPQIVHDVNTLRGERSMLRQGYDQYMEGQAGAGGLLKGFQKERLTNPMMDTEEMSLLETSLDYLSRGNYMAAETTLGLLKGEGFRDTWKRAKAGVSGESKTSFIDVLYEEFPELNPIVAIGAGFALDVVADPINLVPMSWPVKFGQMLKLPKLMKAADNITGASKMLMKAKNVVGDVPGINWAGKAFKPGFALRKQEGAYGMYRDVELKIASIKRNVRQELEKNWDLFREASKTLGVDSEWAAAEMIRAHESGEFARRTGSLGEKFQELFRIDEAMVDPEAMQVLKDAYRHGVRGFAKMAKEEGEAGILNTKSVLKNYFPHIYEKGELVQLPGGKWKVKGQYGFFTSLRYRGAPFFRKPREFDSIESAKNWLAGQKIGGAPIPVPIEHWFRGYAVRRFVGESALAWKSFIDNTLSTFGKPVEGMLEEAAKEAGYKDLAQALSAKKTGFDEIWGIVQTKLPKGQKLVMPTTSLRSPAARTLAEKMLKEGLATGESDLAKIFEEQGPNFIYKLFSKVKGAGLEIDVGDDIIKTLSAKDVYLLPAEIADHIKESFKVFSTDEQVKGFLGAMDGALHVWKSMATSMRLPFHHRNAISNNWLMYLGGVKAPMLPVRAAQAARVQLKDKALKFQGFSSEELIEIADRHGVRAFGWIAADVPKMFQKELFIATERSVLARKLGAGVNPYNPLETVSRLGRKYGTAIEDNARIGLFMDQMLKKGITKKNVTKEALTEAANHVKKHLFDYTELTPFERNIMKRVMPFYTWMRKNAPLQLESIVRHPEKFARLADVERDLYPLFTEEETPAEKAVRPAWLDEMRAQKMKGWTTSTGDPIYTWIDLPSGDLHKMQKLGKYLMSSVSPLAVLAMTAMNVKTWPKSGVIGKPGQKSIAPFYIQFMPKKDWKVMGIEPIRNRKTGKIVLGIDPQWGHALRTALPFLNDWEAMHPGGVSLGVRREGEALPRAISYVTGIKFMPLNKADQALQKYYKTLEFQKNIRRAGKQQVEITAQEQGEIWKETME